MPTTVRDEALRLREVLKFEFLFSARAQFEKELADEVRLIGHVEDITKSVTAADVRGLLESADVLLAHLVLRPFLDAYHIVADRLAAYEDESFDEGAFLQECLRGGQAVGAATQIASAESRSMELFKTALRLARHRELVDGFDDPDIAKRRQEFADEIATAIRRVNTIAELALIGFITRDNAPQISPAPISRTWMSEMAEMRIGWPDRCLPILIANQSGWELRNPCGFTATWIGQQGVDVMIAPDKRDAGQLLPVSHFGNGILTWHLPMLFRTP